jgi:hypothetical protein
LRAELLLLPLLRLLQQLLHLAVQLYHAVQHQRQQQLLLPQLGLLVWR